MAGGQIGLSPPDGLVSAGRRRCLVGDYSQGWKGKGSPRGFADFSSVRGSPSNSVRWVSTNASPQGSHDARQAARLPDRIRPQLAGARGRVILPVRGTRRPVRPASPTARRPRPPDPNADGRAHAPGSAGPLGNAAARPSSSPHTTTSDGTTPGASVLDAGPPLQQAHPASSLVGPPSDSTDDQYRELHPYFHAAPSQ